MLVFNHEISYFYINQTTKNTKTHLKWTTFKILNGNIDTYTLFTSVLEIQTKILAIYIHVAKYKLYYTSLSFKL